MGHPRLIRVRVRSRSRASKVKGNGQECPFHTGYMSNFWGFDGFKAALSLLWRFANW
jgi:hypothetical protein